MQQNERNEIIEQCAKIVDECNREGPYMAIGAAKRIRALKTIIAETQSGSQTD